VEWDLRALDEQVSFVEDEPTHVRVRAARADELRPEPLLRDGPALVRARRAVVEDEERPLRRQARERGLEERAAEVRAPGRVDHGVELGPHGSSPGPHLEDLDADPRAGTTQSLEVLHRGLVDSDEHPVRARP
jgi:hypothetical protein